MKTLAFAVLVTLAAVKAFAAITDSTCIGTLHGVALDEKNHPVPGVTVMLDPIGVDLSYLLPTTVTNEAGVYRFDHVCSGRFTVVVDDVRAGYPPHYWSYLLGRREVKFNKKTHDIELPVLVPPKAASLSLTVRDRRKTSSLAAFDVMFNTTKSKRHDWLTIKQDSAEQLLVPANTELLFRVAATGYREWPKGKKAGKPIRLVPDSQTSLSVELEPLH